MKRPPLLLLLALVLSLWLGGKILWRQMASSAEAQRFLVYVDKMPESAQPFIRREFIEVHPEAFRRAYSLWNWQPISELRLTASFDQRRYFRSIHDHMVGAATREGETRAITAVSSLAPYYGIPQAVGTELQTSQ